MQPWWERGVTPAPRLIHPVAERALDAETDLDLPAWVISEPPAMAAAGA
eukprot:gene29453-33096_t